VSVAVRQRSVGPTRTSSSCGPIVTRSAPTRSHRSLLRTVTLASTSAAPATPLETTAVPDTAYTEPECCEVCLLAPRAGFALVPCGHARFCESCANRMAVAAAGTYVPCMPYIHYDGDALLSLEEMVRSPQGVYPSRSGGKTRFGTDFKL